MRIRQYEIWVADLNPQFGTEAGKIRPVVVVQTDLLNKMHPSTLVCPITTKVQPGSDILRVHIEKGTCGVEDNCDIMLDQVRAIDNKRLIKNAGQVPKAVSLKIKQNLKILFDLE
jgi:mRNA interferase MazF